MNGVGLRIGGILQEEICKKIIGFHLRVITNTSARVESSKLEQSPGTGRGYTAHSSRNTFRQTTHFISVTSLSIEQSWFKEQ